MCLALKGNLYRSLKIAFSCAEADLQSLLMCSLKFSLLSIVIPKSLTDVCEETF